MAKNNTSRIDSDISADDTLVRPREEVFGSSTTADSTIPAEELRDLDLADEDDTLLSSPTAGATLANADDDQVDATASTPVLSETWGGGEPIPPSMVGETDTVSTPFATSSFGVTSGSGAIETPAVEPAPVDLKAQAAQAVDSAKDAAAGALDQAKQKAGEVVDQAKEQVMSRLEDQKGRAVTGLDSLTQALRQTSESLQGAEVPLPLGDYAQSFAGQVDKFTSYLRDTDVDQIAHEVEDYARRNPVLFVGGAFLLGVAVARFLKSSESSAAYRAGGNANNFGVASRDALVPVEGTSRGELSSRTESGTSRFEEDALPANRPLTAHNYVPGIGITGQNENSSL